MQRHPAMGLLFCICLLSLFAAQARADVCGGGSEDQWDGSCLEGIPHGHGVFTFASGVSAVLSSSSLICLGYHRVHFLPRVLIRSHSLQFSNMIQEAAPSCFSVCMSRCLSLLCPLPFSLTHFTCLSFCLFRDFFPSLLMFSLSLFPPASLSAVFISVPVPVPSCTQNKYEGDIDNGLKSGQGEFNWTSGEVYKGEVCFVSDCTS